MVGWLKDFGCIEKVGYKERVSGGGVVRIWFILFLISWSIWNFLFRKEGSGYWRK